MVSRKRTTWTKKEETMKAFLLILLGFVLGLIVYKSWVMYKLKPIAKDMENLKMLVEEYTKELEKKMD